MIIHQPEVITQNGLTLVCTKIETAHRQSFFPEYIWYRVPVRYSGYLSLQSDAFLVPVLLGGMILGENVEVRGVVSPKLAYNLTEYQYILSFRFPEYFHPIEIKYQSLEPLKTEPKEVGTTFSGGVDSLFTLWQHLPENQPNPAYQVTQGVFIKGFDILNTAEGNYRLLLDRFREQAGKIGLEIIPVETNIVSITHLRIPLSYFHGPHIVSVGLFLAGLFRTFFIPSSWDYSNLKRKSYASDPLVDGLLSTDTLEIIHHGASHRRVEKVEAIAEWELAQNILWVCQDHRFDLPAWNCSRCEKCIRTMIPLYALGKLDRYGTFAKPIKKNWEGLRWARKFSLRHNFFTEMFPFVKKHKPGFLPWLRLATFLGYFRYLLVTHPPKFARQWLRRFGYYITRNEAADAYELEEITQLIRESK